MVGRTFACAPALALALLGTTPAEGASSSLQRCAVAKRSAAGRKIAGLTACDGKAVANGAAVDSACTARVRGRFSRAWRKAESRNVCSTTGDEAAIESKVDAHDADLQGRLAVSGPASRCSAGKFRHAGRKAACQFRCAAKAAARGWLLNDPAIQRCMTRCRGKLTAAFRRDEAKGDCHTSGDLVPVDSAVAAFVDDVLGELGGTPASTTTTLPSVTTTTTQVPTTTTTQPSGGTTTSSTTTTTITTTTLPLLVQCCIPGSVGGAFLCQPETAAECGLDGGLDLGPGSCVPDPCPTTSTTSSSSTTTTVTVSSPSTTTTTLFSLPCGGVFPVCIGDCPLGMTCSATINDPFCVCS